MARIGVGATKTARTVRAKKPMRTTLVAVGMMGLAFAGPAASAQQVVDVPAQDRPLRVTLEEVFRVGSMAGADWETFGDVRGVAFDAQGRLHVFDPRSSRVVVTDAEGKLVRTVGKAGRGRGGRPPSPPTVPLSASPFPAPPPRPRS